MLIRGWFHDGQPLLTRPGTSYHEVIWHKIWALFFRLINVSDVFVWAKIIHCSQFIWALFCLTYFAETSLRNFYPDMSKSNRRLCALFGAWCFIFGAGTFSVQHQLSWILWYGVNYQSITLPAYFLAMAILIDVVLTPPSRGSVLKIIFLPFIFASIVLLHPLESAYFLLMSVIFFFFFAKVTLTLLRAMPILSLVLASPFLLAPALLYYAPHFGIPLPTLPNIALLMDTNVLLNRITVLGKNIQDFRMHRGLTTFNEIAITGCLLLFIGLVRYSKEFFSSPKESSTNLRFIFFLTTSSVFFAMAPRQTYVSGLLAFLTADEQVWRFSFASPWFVGFSLWSAYVLKVSPSRWKLLFSIAPVLLIFIFSRYVLSGPFNTTAASMIRSLELIDRHRVGIQFDRTALKRLDLAVNSTAPAEPPKTNIFLIRTDLQTYVRAATGAYVLGDRLWAVDRATFDSLPDRDKYKLIVIDPPADLPVDLDMAAAFPSMGLQGASLN
jgi:hypothetical protein